MTGAENHINSLPTLGRPKSLGLHNWLLSPETQVSRACLPRHCEFDGPFEELRRLPWVARVTHREIISDSTCRPCSSCPLLRRKKRQRVLQFPFYLVLGGMLHADWLLCT